MVLLLTGGSGFIGQSLSRELISRGIKFCNFDVKPPCDSMFTPNWIPVNVLQKEILVKELTRIKPQTVIHLAAKTMDSSSERSDYSDNIHGLQNVIDSILQLLTPPKFIFVSSQHVFKPGTSHKLSVENHSPLGSYGLSKSIGEKMISDSNLQNWVIVRPTNVWGPGSKVLLNGLARQISAGRYFHPRQDKVRRAYSFIDNCAWQISKISLQPISDTNKKIFYIGDGNLSQKDWVQSLKTGLDGRHLKTFPRSFFLLLSLIGEGARVIGIDFPMNLNRYRSLTTSNPVPLEETLQLLGNPPVDQDTAMQLTVHWLKSFSS